MSLLLNELGEKLAGMRIEISGLMSLKIRLTTFVIQSQWILKIPYLFYIHQDLPESQKEYYIQQLDISWELISLLNIYSGLIKMINIGAQQMLVGLQDILIFFMGRYQMELLLSCLRECPHIPMHQGAGKYVMSIK